jgi:hypothetical protein
VLIIDELGYVPPSVLAMLALLRVAPLLPSPTLRAVPGVMPGRDGKAGSLIELESRVGCH